MPDSKTVKTTPRPGQDHHKVEDFLARRAGGREPYAQLLPVT